MLGAVFAGLALIIFLGVSSLGPCFYRRREKAKEESGHESRHDTSVTAENSLESAGSDYMEF